MCICTNGSVPFFDKFSPFFLPGDFLQVNGSIYFYHSYQVELLDPASWTFSPVSTLPSAATANNNGTRIVSAFLLPRYMEILGPIPEDLDSRLKNCLLYTSDAADE